MAKRSMGFLLEAAGTEPDAGPGSDSHQVTVVQCASVSPVFNWE